MKTFLFITGLSMNLLLCCGPFEEQATSVKPVKSVMICSPQRTQATSSYADMLKSKAATLPKKATKP